MVVWGVIGSMRALKPTQYGRMEKITVLVVEDETLIRMGTAYMLQDAGYGVVEAADADAAIGILENSTDIRVVLTDIKMPGMLCGLKLARAVFDRWPPIHLIVASGLSIPSETEFPGMARFIRKPYAPDHILRTLDEMLGPNPLRYLPTVKQNYGRVACGGRPRFG